MRQWAISVGINQYQFFQPLSYAQQDAQAMQRFLVEDAGIPAEQCLLLTETSAPQWGKSTVPDRETIQSWLDLLVQRYIAPGDVLWCFFSGYGVCQEGQDYFVPIEGNPTAIPATAIPLEAIFRRLSQVSKATVLVMFDINRNESSSYETVGTHTMHLASITGIPTILSCQPGQFSRETSALGHGFFTAALLESLRDRRCATLSAVEQYLSDRLPELSEHYWRPIQQAVIICPDEKRQQPLLPLSVLATHEAYQRDDRAVATHFVTAPTALENGTLSATDAWVATALKPSSSEGTPYRPYGGTTNGNGLGKPVSPNGQSVDSKETAIAVPNGRSTATAHSHNGASQATNGATPNANGVTPVYPPIGSTLANGTHTEPPIDSGTQNYENRVAPPVQVPPVPQPNSDYPEDANEIPDALFWRPMLLWGGLVAVGLILGVLLRNCASFTPKVPAAQKSSVGATRPSPSATGQPGGTPSPTAPASVKTVLPIAPSPTTATKTVPPQTIATTQVGVSGASRLDPVAGQPPSTTQTHPTQTNGATSIALSAPSSLAKAKALVSVNSDQASPYWYAIQEAKKVKPGQPDYAQAKQEIALWSRQMMTIARQRGRQGHYDAAIVAARLIPQDQPVYAEAKSALTRWCPSLKRQQSVNRVQQQQANDVCQNLPS